ncbi:DUF1573 domain-containing protein [Niastella caeni]|uniref:DUF1573 domain-containing protein n=1 Tax=Niastella caeni TaxID=2569763 RepID=A0A4S8HYY7_9BACT|nr:DUF1573 domain-containing protein [Niastella caeni]THU40755.1 DUF1573 domain-containing protein [Niastella caeni]
MKKMLLLVCLAAFAFTTQAQTATDTKPAETLQLKETAYNFGKIQQGRPVTHNFEIVNTGKEPMMLENVQASCGCTTPEWTKDAIQPGASSTIKVGYNAANEGPFNKTITIQYNNQQTKVLTILGTVYKGPTTSAPVNASLSLLKN